MYVLQNNVEIIRGAKNCCIYDLNSRKMFSLTSEYADFLEGLINGDYSQDDIPKGLLDYLVKEGVLANSNELLEKIPQFEYEGRVDFAWIEITQNCNLKCCHCYEGSSRNLRKPEMHYSDFVKVVDGLTEIGVKRIQLVGGEPLMHKDIEKMILYVSDKFDFIEVFTNGTLLTDSTLDLFKAKGVSLAFSLYSNDATVHDGVTRTAGSFALTSSVIAKATEKGIGVRVASVEMKGVPRFEFSCSGVEHRTDFPRLTGRADLSLYTDEMLRRKLITKSTFKKPLEPSQYYKNKVVHNCFGDLLYIDCNLDIYPCAMERRVSCGNLKRVSLREKTFSEIARMNKDKVEGCRDCEFRYACYDCRADNGCETFNSKPWYCTYDENEGIWQNEDDFIAQLRAKDTNND